MCVWGGGGGGNKIETCPGSRHYKSVLGWGRDIAVLNLGGEGLFAIIVIHTNDGIAQQRLPALVIYVNSLQLHYINFYSHFVLFFNSV